MLLTHENGCLKVFAETYTLEFAKDRPFVKVFNPDGSRVMDLFVLSSVHTAAQRDDTTSIQAWSPAESLQEMVITLEAASSAWDRKLYRFRCQPRRFSYEIEVYGQGDIDEVRYFGGYSSAQVRWGSGFFQSGQNFQQGFNPEPSSDEIYTFAPEAGSCINLTGVPLPGKADWFFTPPPFCYAFQLKDRWVSMGVEAHPGENGYTELIYQGSRGSFNLALGYEGHTHIDGMYRLPAIGFDFGADPYTLLAMHVQHLRARGLVHNQRVTNRPVWWSEPIFCGWGAQCHLANQAGGRGPDFATQDSYEGFMASLSSKGILPGTVVLDDKWQITYGENEVDELKWPNLADFISERHDLNQHVLLWLKAWDPEGIPVEECITNAAGLPVSVDPTHPGFEERLRASVRRMISPEGYDADGFKIDFTARIPSGPGLRAYGDAWGLELMRLYLGILYDEAKKVKPDALIIAHTPHPYLADVIDAIRLNDINTGHDVCSQMIHRARVAAIACPDALIDTDNWPLPDKAAWRAYLDQKPGLGIPALYYASHIDTTGEPLSDADFALLRDSWAGYRAALSARRRSQTEEKISELGGAYLPDSHPLVKRMVLLDTQPVLTKPFKALGSESIHGG
jgi:hypothetical protein